MIDILRPELHIEADPADYYENNCLKFAILSLLSTNSKGGINSLRNPHQIGKSSPHNVPVIYFQPISFYFKIPIEISLLCFDNETW